MDGVLQKTLQTTYMQMSAGKNTVMNQAQLDYNNNNKKSTFKFMIFTQAHTFN